MTRFVIAFCLSVAGAALLGAQGQSRGGVVGSRIETPPVSLRSLPAPVVAGPIASVAVGDASHDYPFYAAAVDLKARGYVEEEFFIEGNAVRYTTPAGVTGAVVSEA